MKENSKLRQNEQQETTQQQHHQQKAEGTEFASVEDMLRYDSAQNAAPPSLAEKVNKSVNAEAGQSWWKRLVWSLKAK